MEAVSRGLFDYIKLLVGQIFGFWFCYVAWKAVSDPAPSHKIVGSSAVPMSLKTTFLGQEIASLPYFLVGLALIALFVGIVYFSAFYDQNELLREDYILRFGLDKSAIKNEVRLLLTGNMFFQYVTPLVGFWWFDHPPKFYLRVCDRLRELGYLEE